MGDTVRVIEIVSYGLIALLGARLMWVKGHGFLKAVRTLRWGDKAVAASYRMTMCIVITTTMSMPSS